MSIVLADYVLDLRGKLYLPVAPRIAYFAESRPDWAIVTDVIVVEDVPRMVRATVMDADGRVRATAHKTVTPFDGGAVEKAETGAIGRALSLIGIGTLMALDHDEDDEIAEAPVAKPPTRKADPRDIPPTPAELADIVNLGLDDLRTAYAAAMAAGRATLAAHIKGMADALKTKAAA